MEIAELERDVVDRFIFFVTAPRDEPRGSIRVWHASDVEIDKFRKFIVVSFLLLSFCLSASCNSSIQYHKIIVFLRLNRLFDRTFTRLWALLDEVCLDQMFEVHPLLEA